MPILTTPPPLVRLTEPSYADGSSAIARTDDAPLIASILFDQNEDMPNGAGLSPLFVDWGQFIDHDLDLTRDASGEIIQVTGLAGPFQRSNFTVEDLGDGQLLRTPVNEITAAIDANMIYGSTGDRLADIRSFEGGRVRTGEVAPDGRSLMPFAGETDVMAGGEATDSPIFFAGDVRANENIALTMLHTVFVREHNHWADRLAAENPEWDDDTLFQTARAIVEYELQTITYRDWLPTLLAGRPEAETLAESLTTSLSEAESDAVDGQISVEFSTAAFRFGHTMVSSLVPLLDERGVQSDELSLAVADVVFNVQPLVDGYLDDLMRGSAATLAQEVDGKVIDDLNFFLRAPDVVTGFSLAALNILRGRDHGLTTYLEARADLLGDIDLETIAADDFSVITSDATVQNDLNAVYDSVFDVDLWVGGLTEDRPVGTLMGPLFSHILVEQFDRTWRADSSFRDLPDGLSAALLAEIESQDINAIIMRNTGLTHLQDNPFVAAARFSTDGSGTDVSGTSLGDFLFGDDLANSLIGLDGDDTVFAEAGNDTIEGGSGNDEIAGGPGVDSLQLSGSDQEYHVAFYQDGTVKVEHKVTGGDGTDHLTGVEKIEF
ncbi:MAG: hypothetical protein HKN30_11080, partial [Sulfitobacter sp.]|nr:hypothetical protein [Sulfitobacter sp.]